MYVAYYMCVIVIIFVLNYLTKTLLSSEHCDTAQFLTAWLWGWNESECKENMLCKCGPDVTYFIHIYVPRYRVGLNFSESHKITVTIFSTLAFSLPLGYKSSAFEENHLGKSYEGVTLDQIQSILCHQQKWRKHLLSVGDRVLPEFSVSLFPCTMELTLSRVKH